MGLPDRSGPKLATTTAGTNSWSKTQVEERGMAYFELVREHAGKSLGRRK